jgi:DNA replication and repair protein RecF
LHIPAEEGADTPAIFFFLRHLNKISASLSFLSEITLTQFRNFHHQTFHFNAPVMGIAGRNGVGKTNLLDAIYYLCYTKSYFQSKEINNVQNGTDGFRIQGNWTSALAPYAADQTICIWREGKKTVRENEEEYVRVTDHIGKYNAVMIAPDDLELINGGSELRRKFMDGLLAQTEPGYLDHLLFYQKTLQQKNAYLKQNGGRIPDHDLLDIYDNQLAHHGAVLIGGRTKLASILPAATCENYDLLSGGGEPVAMRYKPCAEPEDLKAVFRQSRGRDIDFKRTTSGPHTEDWYFSIQENALKIQASQGQKKSFLISLKLAQLQWLQQLHKTPLLLLDDIFEKLDRSRLSRLFELLRRMSPAQIFLTHTDIADLEKNKNIYGEALQLIELS